MSLHLLLDFADEVRDGDGSRRRRRPGELLRLVCELRLPRLEQACEQAERAAAVGRRTVLSVAGERERAVEAGKRLGPPAPP